MKIKIELKVVMEVLKERYELHRRLEKMGIELNKLADWDYELIERMIKNIGIDKGEERNGRSLSSIADDLLSFYLSDDVKWEEVEEWFIDYLQEKENK